MNYSNQPYSPGGFRVMPPAIKIIIIANISVFLIQMTIIPLGTFITTYGALWPIAAQGPSPFHIWQPVSYMFIHGGLMHLFFNMFMLWMFGMEIENHWGTKEFTIYYFVCGIGAAIIHLIATIGSPAPAVGASGAVLGIMLAFGMMFPDRYIYIYFLFPVKAKFLIIGLVILDLLGTMGNSNVAHFAHLGGMLVGFAYIKFRQQGFSFSEWLDKTFPKKDDDGSGPKLYKKDKEENSMPASEAEIDAILDKISRDGYASLTEKEKQKLLKAGGK